MKLRGIFSMGLLIPANEIEGAKSSEELTAILDITKYETPEEKTQNRVEASNQAAANARKAGGNPKLPIYGLDAHRRYKDVLNEGEWVVVTEKVHGSNARYVHHKGRLFVGSHKVMRGCTRSPISEFFDRLKLKVKDLLGIKHRAHILQTAGDIWWEAAEKYNLKERLATFPDHVLYGEIYGEGVQDLTYDSPKGRKFVAFDVYDLKANRFLGWHDFVEFIRKLNDIAGEQINNVPVEWIGRWSPEWALHSKDVADAGKSNLNPKQIIEGVVIKPVIERWDDTIGRVALKLVGEAYLLSRKD
jgi:RNA ligase (TIGR02306 family)